MPTVQRASEPTFQFPLGIISIAQIDWLDLQEMKKELNFQFPLGIISIARRAIYGPKSTALRPKLSIPSWDYFYRTHQ